MREWQVRMVSANPESIVPAAMLPFHVEAIRDVRAPTESLFAYLDDHRRLSAHMSRSSWMMAKSRMAVELDASEGRAVGAKIHMWGRVLGIPLAVDEVVTERSPPLKKVWQTTGIPKLLVIGPYRMGFEIVPQATSSSLRIFIDYGMPGTQFASWLGRLFGRAYARWCSESMVDDAVRHFG